MKLTLLKAQRTGNRIYLDLDPPVPVGVVAHCKKSLPCEPETVSNLSVKPLPSGNAILTSPETESAEIFSRRPFWCIPPRFRRLSYPRQSPARLPLRSDAARRAVYIYLPEYPLRLDVSGHRIRAQLRCLYVARRRSFRIRCPRASLCVPPSIEISPEVVP